jgi:Domain of unknown function (DUF4157)
MEYKRRPGTASVATAPLVFRPQPPTAEQLAVQRQQAAWGQLRAEHQAEHTRLQRLALPGQVAAFTRLGTGQAQVQRERAAGVLEAAGAMRLDEEIIQRAGEQLALQRQALQTSSAVIRDQNLLPLRTAYEVDRLQRSLDLQAPRPPADAQHRQALMQRATGEMLGTLTADAHSLPPLVRAEAASGVIQRFAQLGVAAEPLRDVLLQRAPAAMRSSVEQVLSVQRRQETSGLQQRAKGTLLVQHYALQRLAAALEAQHADQQQQTLTERIQARRGAGNPLPETVKRQLEQGLNADLSRVRIHDDAEADLLSKSVAATAFTSGQDIFFGAGTYQPNTQTGLELLAHEAAHTVQQAQGKVGPGIDPDAGLEQQAQQFGAQFVLESSGGVASGGQAPAPAGSAHPKLQGEQPGAVQRKVTSPRAAAEPKATPRASAPSVAPRTTSRQPTTSSRSQGTTPSGAVAASPTAAKPAGTTPARPKPTAPTAASAARTRALDANYLIRSDGNSSLRPRPNSPSPKADLHVLLASLPGVNAKTLNTLTRDLKAQLQAGTLKAGDIKRLAQQAYTLKHYGVGSGPDILKSVQGTQQDMTHSSPFQLKMQQVNAALNFDVGEWAINKVDTAGAQWATRRGNTELAQFFQQDQQQAAALKKMGTGPALLAAARAVPAQLQTPTGEYTWGSGIAGVGNLVGAGDIKGLFTGTDLKGQPVNKYQAGVNLGLTAVIGPAAGRGAVAAGRAAQGALARTGGTLARAGQGLSAEARYQAALLAWKTGLNHPPLALPGGGAARLRPPPPNRADFAPSNAMTRGGQGGARPASTSAPKPPLPPALMAASALTGQARQTALAKLLPKWGQAAAAVGQPATASNLPKGYLYAKIPLSSGRFEIRGYQARSRPGEVPSFVQGKDGTWQPGGLSINTESASISSNYRLARAAEYNRNNRQPQLPNVKAATNNHHLTPDNVMRDSELFQAAFAKSAVGPDRATGMITLATSPENLAAFRAQGEVMSDVVHNTQHPKTDKLITLELQEYVRTLQAEQKLPQLLKSATPQQLKEAIEGWDRKLREDFMNRPDTLPRNSDGTLASNQAEPKELNA